MGLAAIPNWSNSSPVVHLVGSFNCYIRKIRDSTQPTGDWATPTANNITWHQVKLIVSQRVHSLYNVCIPLPEASFHSCNAVHVPVAFIQFCYLPERSILILVKMHMYTPAAVSNCVLPLVLFKPHLQPFHCSNSLFACHALHIALPLCK